jgi:carboxyl-terminal processing protease
MNKCLERAFAIFLIQVLLIVPSCLTTRIEKAIKTPDQYWTETGINSTELETLLANQSCLHDQRSFLACVNAINTMAEKFNLSLQQDGSLKVLSDLKMDIAATEKNQLKKWESVFRGPELEMPFSFLEKWKELDTKYIGRSERAGVIAQGINGFLSVYKDPHTYIIPISLYEETIASSEAKQNKAGFIFRRSGRKIFVKKVFEGSPADLAGLKKADEIVEINGQATASLMLSKISEIIRLKHGERLGVLVQRGSQRKYLEVLKSEKVYPSVTSKILTGSSRLGLLMIHKFSKESCAQTRQNLIELEEQGIRGLMVDVRDNPGGQLDQAACIISLFVAKGTELFETRYLDTTRPSEPYLAEQDPIYNGPLAVLINSGSASAAEVLAGSLKDLGRATLVGEKTFGKGSFQDGHVWGPNARIALFQTEGLYYFPSGWTPQLVGLEPDVPVAFNNSDQREVELYYSPIQPRDSWVGPQTLAWLNQFGCEAKALGLQDINDLSSQLADDPQLKEAHGWLLCHSKGSKGSPAAESQQ